MRLTLEDLVEHNVAFDEDEIDTKKGTVMLNANDLFAWACADGETITEADLPEFERALNDCGGDWGVANDLFISRRRQERPQGACYTFIPKRLWPLFDECGPERETGLGNPCKPGEYRPESQRE